MDIQIMLLKLLVNIIPIVSIIYIVFGIRMIWQKADKGVSYFSLFLFASAIYSLGYYLELNSSSLDTMLQIRNFEFLGVTFIPTFAILFISDLTKTIIKKKAKLILLLFSTMLWLLFITNPFHSLFYKSIVIYVGEYSAPVTEKGIAFYLLIAYFGVLLFSSSRMLLRAYKKAEKKYRKSSYFIMLITFQIPWLTILFIILGLDTIFDPTPTSIFIICALFAINELKNNMFELQIIKWNDIFFDIEEAAFLLDKEGEIVSMNKNADSLFKELKKSVWDIIEALDESEYNNEPAFFTIDNKIKWFNVKKNIFDIKNKLVSYMLINITGKKNASMITEAFFNAIEDFVFIATEKGRLLFVNNQVKKRLEYSDDDLKKMYIFDFYPNDRINEAKELFAKIMQNQGNYCHLPLQTKSKKSIPVETRVWLGDWNGNAVIYGMSKDISLLMETEDKFEKSFINNPAIMAITDINTNKYLNINDAFIHKLGYAKEEAIGKTPYELGLCDIDDCETLKNLQCKGKYSDFEMNVYTKNREKLTGLFFGDLIHTDGSAQLLTVMLDITENKIAHEKIKSSEEQFRLLITQMQQGLAVHEMIYDEEGRAIDYRFISINESFERITGLIGKDIIGKTVLEILPNTERYWIEIYGKVALTGQPYQFEDYSVELDKYFSISAYSPKKNQFAVIVTDITEKKKIENEIEFLSFHDQLTGLYNRRYFDNAINQLDKNEHFPLTLIMADVNGLKLTNDAFGHMAGDILLTKVANILKGVCRKDDIVARIGGDEFVLLLPNTDSNSAEELISRINIAIENDKMDNIILSISIGYAIKTDESQEFNEVYKKAEDEMYKNKLSESSSMRSKTIDLIMNTLYEKNNREMIHSKRVSEFCVAIAEALKLEKDAVNQVRLAGLMHDIGKIGINEKILNKNKKLNKDEWSEIERHTEIGYRILSSVNEFSEIAEYVLEHHERWDGNGYPRGLKGEEISLHARIITIADAFDAMTTDRPYHNAMNKQEAINELISCSGTQFDPYITNLFVHHVLNRE